MSDVTMLVITVRCTSCDHDLMVGRYADGDDPETTGICAMAAANHLTSNAGHQLAYQTETAEAYAARLAEAASEAQLLQGEIAAHVRESAERQRARHLRLNQPAATGSQLVNGMLV